MARSSLATAIGARLCVVSSQLVTREDAGQLLLREKVKFRLKLLHEPLPFFSLPALGHLLLNEPDGSPPNLQEESGPVKAVFYLLPSARVHILNRISDGLRRIAARLLSAVFRPTYYNGFRCFMPIYMDRHFVKGAPPVP